MATANRSHAYELGHSDRELKRLETQALLIDPMTRQYFSSAGLEAGMRVLDIGSGAGHVAFLAAELVGATGEVIGTDRSPEAVTAALAEAKARSLVNVSFRLGDPTTLAFDRPFDAVVGRYVLMFSPDPAAMLKGIVGHLRPGGIIVFHEAGGLGARSYPPRPPMIAVMSGSSRRFARSALIRKCVSTYILRFSLPGCPPRPWGCKAWSGEHPAT